MAICGKLHILTTCTNQKSDDAPKDLRLRNHTHRVPRDAAKAWVAASQKTPVLSLPAQNLYVGAHWQESLRSQEVANAQNVRATLSVLSAGLGLIEATDCVPPYAASFTPGEDSIHNLAWPSSAKSVKERNRAWWNHLHRYFNRPSLLRFANCDPKLTRLLVVVSKDYYLAIEHELLELISRGVPTLIVSAGLASDRGIANPALHDFILPFNDKFKQVEPYLNKTNTTLNIRLANWLIRNHLDQLMTTPATLYQTVDDIERSLPAMKRRDVNPMTDDEVIDYIGKHYVRGESTATKLLRKLRHEAKLSCEQKRFGGLFRTYENTQQGDLFDHV